MEKYHFHLAGTGVFLYACGDGIPGIDTGEFMTAPATVRNLVQRFEQHRDTYRSGRYNETQLRREFLDPFFEALGWDAFNKQSYAEMYKGVIHEDSLKIEGENKAPDFAFHIGGTRKFFVEAKKPAVNIEFNIHPAFQLRRYAWSARLPLCTRQEQEMVKREIESTDGRIDRLVYELSHSATLRG